MNRPYRDGGGHNPKLVICRHYSRAREGVIVRIFLSTLPNTRGKLGRFSVRDAERSGVSRLMRHILLLDELL